MSHFKGHFEGAKTFLTPKLSRAQQGQFNGSYSYCPTKKNYVLQFLKQRDINSYYDHEFQGPPLPSECVIYLLCTGGVPILHTVLTNNPPQRYIE